MVISYIYIYVASALPNNNEFRKWANSTGFFGDIITPISTLFLWIVNVFIINYLFKNDLALVLTYIASLLILGYWVIIKTNFLINNKDYLIWSEQIIHKSLLTINAALVLSIIIFELQGPALTVQLTEILILSSIAFFINNKLILVWWFNNFNKLFGYFNKIQKYIEYDRNNVILNTIELILITIFIISLYFIMRFEWDHIYRINLLVLFFSIYLILSSIKSEWNFNHHVTTAITILYSFTVSLTWYIWKALKLYVLPSREPYNKVDSGYYTFDFRDASKYNILYTNNRGLDLNKNTYRSLNTHFQTYDSSLLATLTVWQYWWWMMFIFVMALFNGLLIKIFFNNTININPKTHTSLKSNGRWGDLVASLFPVFWCTNILINSNYILRVIENQTETGVFTLRVRGKQWYWVYKFSVNISDDVQQHGFIAGRGKKLPHNYGFHNYKSVVLQKKQTFFKKVKIVYITNLNYNRVVEKYYNKFCLNNKLINKIKYLNQSKFIKLNNTSITDFLQLNAYKSIDRLQKKITYDKYFHRDYEYRLILNKNPMYENGSNLFNVRVKNYDWYKQYNRHFFTLQQQPKKTWFIKNNKNIIHLVNDSEKKKKIVPVNNYLKRKVANRLRLLSTYNTLVLPINTNITVITNSFDVVHSWFVPGLGLKFDCVPGRSTHYSLRIDKAGIYYGHCAEVCGRFHHHMPIKIIALPFGQFLYYYDMYYVLATAK